MIHKPVLQKEVLKYLDPKANENFIDCTIGEGGHTIAILEKNKPNGKVLGIEWDAELYKKLLAIELKSFIRGRLILVNDCYINLENIVKKHKFGPFSGILFDLGMSSWHLEKSERGFSFLGDEPLIMRYDWSRQKGLTAEKIVNSWSESEIEKILREYGEERFAKRIAKKIAKERKIKLIKSTSQLVEIIKKAVPIRYQRSRIHPATRTFQALRIAVNDELKNLKETLSQALDVLTPGGKLVVISFHSLEDRIVKNFFKKHVGPTCENLKILTKKPIIPSQREIKINRRSRSAKLRAAIKT